VQHQELGHLALACAETESFAEGCHELAPADRVIAPEALAGIMEQHAQVERQWILELDEHPPQLRLDVHQVPGAQRIQPSQRPERVNVDRVHVVQVALVVRGDPPELGDQRPEHPERVHLVQHCTSTRR